MKTIIFVHGMFQNPKSWSHWIRYFGDRGYPCLAPAWPLHDGEPAALRASPPAGLGELRLEQIVTEVLDRAASLDRPIMIGHSVGGLVTQLALQRPGLLSAGVAIDSVAPNAMLDFDWGFIKNSAIITNPLKGDQPVSMDAETFHSSFANTLGKAEAERAFEAFATHDSRNVLRDCMGPTGHIDLAREHPPLLLIGGEKDQIIPADLSARNAHAYRHAGSAVTYREFTGRSHFICGEPGWEEVAAFTANWLDQQVLT